MSDLEARIADVLEDHRREFAIDDPRTRCVCGWRSGTDYIGAIVHRQHQAAMLAPVIREREAEAWAAGLRTKSDEWMRAVTEHSKGGNGPIEKAINPYRSNDV